MTYALALTAVLLPLTFLLGYRAGQDRAERRRHAGPARPGLYTPRHAAPDQYDWPWPADDIRAASDERARQAYRDRTDFHARANDLVQQWQAEQIPDQRHP